MKNSMSMKIGLAALVALFIVACSSGGGQKTTGSKPDYTTMSPEELAEYLIYKEKGFNLKQKVQEGGTIGDRMKQDQIQKICSGLKKRKIDGDTAEKVIGIAKKNMVYPKGGIKLGDWKKGRTIAQNAYGFRVGHKTDKHGKRKPGGMCINCHQLDREIKIPSGNVGPSLSGFGKIRGQSEAVKKYTYEIIYNPHSVFPCTNMPRLGANGFINQEQIRDVMAYLLDPKSLINQ